MVFFISRPPFFSGSAPTSREVSVSTLLIIERTESDFYSHFSISSGFGAFKQLIHILLQYFE
jgi:hypothetical protein